MASYVPSYPSTEWPFREHFNTNYVPSDPEIAQIRAHLTPHEAELKRLESLIRDLTAQRDRLQKYIEPYKVLISHPRRLPQDVVETIFLDCIPSQCTMSPTEAPLLLGHICSGWWSVAFSMPQLWISLDVFDDGLGREDREAATINWLERSAPLPLTLSVMRASHNRSTTLIDLLIRFSARWRAFHISNLNGTEIFKLAEARAPLLADIKLELSGHEIEGLDLQTHVLSSPLLRGMNSGKVSITTPVLSALVPPTPFTWSHLTSLTLLCTDLDPWNSLSARTVYRLLKGCTHLRLFQFHLGVQRGIDENPSLSVLSLPFLKSLIIRPATPASLWALVELFEYFAMPRLKEFHVMGKICHSEVPMVPGVEFLRRLSEGSPFISDLHLNLLDFTTTSLISTLHLFPCITKLNLLALEGAGRQPNVTAFLQILTPTASVPNPCPALEELITEAQWLEDGVLENFLQRHLDHGTSLRRFRLYLRCVPPEIIPDLRPFLARGLDVSVNYPSVGSRLQFYWVDIER